MSQVAGAALVFEQGVTAQAVERAFAPWLEGAVQDEPGAWDPPGLSDARMTLRSHPSGYHVLVLRFSDKVLYRDDPEPLRRLVRWMVLGAEHGATLGLLARFGHQVLDPWLNDQILVPLREGRWDHLEKAQYRWLLERSGSEVPGEILQEGPWGVLVDLDGG